MDSKSLNNGFPHHVPRTITDHIYHKWSTFLLSWYARVLAIIVWGGYIYVSILGFMNMEAKIDARKLLLDDSPLQKVEQLMRYEVWTEMQMLHVYVMNVPDMTVPANLDTVFKFVDELETTLFSYGPNSTTFWLKHYMKYVQFNSPVAPGQTFGFDSRSTNQYFTYKLLPEYLELQARYLLPFVHYNKTACKLNEKTCIRNFVFTTGYFNVTTFVDRNRALKSWRRIMAEYSQLNASVYNSLDFFADQVDSIESTTKSTSLMALVCMAVVCVIFIPSVVSILFATLSVLSINLGVLGFLVHWNVDLDPLSMSGLLMSIGFSVDYTAHISYHYYKVDAQTKHERLVMALSSIGWPMIQSALSTVLAVAVLNIHGSYMLVVFFKTVFLVCFLGLFHGLFLLPVCLPIMPEFLQPKSRKAKQSKNKLNVVADAYHQKNEKSQSLEMTSDELDKSDSGSTDSGHPTSIANTPAISNVTLNTIKNTPTHLNGLKDKLGNLTQGSSGMARKYLSPLALSPPTKTASDTQLDKMEEKDIDSISGSLQRRPPKQP